VTGRRASTIVLRVVGGLLILGGLLSLLDVLGIRLIRPHSGWVFQRDEHFAWLMGVSYLRGYAAMVASVVSGAAFLFAGVQLIRMRKSGWIAALAVLGYAALSLFLFVVTDRIEAYFHDLVSTSPGTVGTFQASMMLQEQRAKIDTAYRIAIFFGTLHLVLLGYVAFEWRRFVGHEVWVPSRRLVCLRALGGVLALAGVGVWAFWGAQYLVRWQVLERARRSPDKVTEENYRRLSPKGQRLVDAALVRTLTRDRPSLLPDILNRVGHLDLSLLTAADIPGIVALGRTGSAEVRAFCYGFLFPDIGTAGVVRCLTDAANGQKDSAWRSAVTTLSSLSPSSPVPQQVLDLPTESSADRISLILLIQYFSSPRVTEILIEMTKDPDPKVRRWALSGLAKHPGLSSELAALAALQDADLEGRFWACWTLGDIGTAASIVGLIDVLKRPDEVKMHPREPAGEVRDLSSFPDVSLKEYAADALSDITGRDFGEDAQAWEEWWREAEATFDLKRNLVERLLTPLAPPPEGPFKSTDEVRQAPFLKMSSRQHKALRAIQTHGFRDLAPKLALYLEKSDEQAPYRYWAADFLAEWGFREGVAWLIEWVDNDLSSGNRMFAIRTLGRTCGVNFFSDKKRWREWWRERRDRFPSAAERRSGGQYRR